MKSPKDPSNPLRRKPKSAGSPSVPPAPQTASPPAATRKARPLVRLKPSSPAPQPAPPGLAAPAKVGKPGPAKPIQKAKTARAKPVAPTRSVTPAKRAADSGPKDEKIELHRGPATLPSPPPVKPAGGHPIAPSLPSILFEGDETPGAVPAGRGPRFPLSHPGLAGVELAADVAREISGLPAAYSTRRLSLVARDADWLHAQWDFSAEQLEAYRVPGRSGLELRVFREAAGGEVVASVTVPWAARSWFLHVGPAGARYVAELGYVEAGGRWLAIARSASVVTPALQEGEGDAEEFATIPVDVPFAEIFAKVKAVVEEARLQCDAESAPLMEMLVGLRSAGFVDLPVAAAVPGADWSPAQERALAAVMRLDAERHVWVGSLDVTELVRRGLAAGGWSLSAPDFSVPGKPVVPAPGRAEAAGGGVSSAERAGAAPSRRGFWFNVNAEIVLYGATEPDATLTVAGQRIRLRPDGSFSLRFALPDGRYELAVAAVAADRHDGRSARLEFGRHTEYRGDVGAHPQDEQLRAPRAENLK